MEPNYSQAPDTSNDWSVPLVSSDQCLQDAENARQHPQEGWSQQQAFNMCEQPYRPPAAPAPPKAADSDTGDDGLQGVRDWLRNNITDRPVTGTLPPPAPVVGSPECQQFADNHQGPPGSPWNHDQLVKMCEKSKQTAAPATPFDHLAE